MTPVTPVLLCRVPVAALREVDTASGQQAPPTVALLQRRPVPLPGR